MGIVNQPQLNQMLQTPKRSDEQLYTAPLLSEFGLAHSKTNTKMDCVLRGKIKH